MTAINLACGVIFDARMKVEATTEKLRTEEVASGTCRSPGKPAIWTYSIHCVLLILIVVQVDSGALGTEIRPAAFVSRSQPEENGHVQTCNPWRGGS